MLDERPVMLVDAYNLFIRNFVANPLMAEGQHVGGVTGFLQSLNSLLAAHRPKECVIVWEGGGSTRRQSIFPDYKSKRRPVKLNRFHEGEIPDTFENRNWQVRLLIHTMKNLPVRQIYVSDCEADDVIGYIAKYSYDFAFRILHKNVTIGKKCNCYVSRLLTTHLLTVRLAELVKASALRADFERSVGSIPTVCNVNSFFALLSAYR